MTFVNPSNPKRFEGTYATDSQGRLAERHPNNYPSNPTGNQAWRRVQDAADAMLGWNTANLPIEALDDLVHAFELLDDVTWHLPRVYGFVCRYKIRFGGMTQDHYSEFSAHESMVEAIRWAKEWERKIPQGEQGDSSTGPWEITWAPARVNLFRAFGTDPAKFIVRS